MLYIIFKNAETLAPSIGFASDIESIGSEVSGNFADFTLPFTNPAVIAQNSVVFAVMGEFFCCLFIYCLVC